MRNRRRNRRCPALPSRLLFQGTFENRFTSSASL